MSFGRSLAAPACHLCARGAQLGTFDGMIVVHAVVEALPQYRDECLALLRRMREETRSRDDGCLDYTFYVDIDDDCRFICTEVWRDEQSLRDHLAAPHMNDPDSRFGEYTASSERIEVWRADPVDISEFLG